VNDYSGIYQYDPAGTSSYIGIPSTSIWGGNIFTATADENLTAVGFYTNDVSASYDVRVYKNPTAGGPVGSTILSQKTGTIPMSGYHTISLDTPVFLSVGDIFSIVVHLTNPSYGYPLAVENPASGPIGNTWSANPGEGYVSSDGNSWTDIVTIPGFVNTSICIKGYTNTITPPPVANFTSNVTTGLVPLTVQFTDTSTGSPTSWLWNFGEGNTSSSQNPVHTYTTAVVYRNLTASNAGGSDTRVCTRLYQCTNPVPLPPVASFTSNVTSGDIPPVSSLMIHLPGNPNVVLLDIWNGANLQSETRFIL
jgi:PKD repeat protein